MSELGKILKGAIEDWSEQLLRTSGLVQIARQGAMSPRALALYLESLRHLFQNSERNLGLAAERARALRADEMAAYFERKCQEERGHDGWAVGDLSRLPTGVANDVRPAQSIVELVALQRSLIAQHPMCFVVYAMWAEYFTVLVGDEWVAALCGCGFERAQLTAVTNHVDSDRAHAARAFDQIDGLWSGEPDRSTLLDVIARAGRAFEAFCNEVCEEARRAA